MRITLKSRIYKYLRARPNQKILSAEIERLTFENTKHIGSTGSRALRALYEEKKVQREGKGKLAVYWYQPSKYELYHQQKLI